VKLAVGMRWIVAALLAALAPLVLAGCSARPPAALLKPAERAPQFTPKARMLVATTRDHMRHGDTDAFGAERSEMLNFSDVTVSIPTHHKVGEIEWPNQTPPDPAYHFITTARSSLDRAGFLSAVRSATRNPGPEHDEVLVFVHGYNTLYHEAVYRFAQIIHDTGFTGTAILFAWPSRGSTAHYVADREASTYSRDYLERLLIDLAALREVRQINILAHSMGTWPVIEALRQARIAGHGDFSGKLSEVILAAPDIDVGVFRTELDTIGRLPRPMTVLVSRDDNALALARTLGGGIDRVGSANLDDPRVVAAVRHYNLRVVDITKVTGLDSTNHAKFAQSSVLTKAIGHGIAHDNKAGLLSQGGVIQAVTDVGQSIIKVPSTILGLPPVEISGQ